MADDKSSNQKILEEAVKKAKELDSLLARAEARKKLYLSLETDITAQQKINMGYEEEKLEYMRSSLVELDYIVEKFKFVETYANSTDQKLKDIALEYKGILDTLKLSQEVYEKNFDVVGEQYEETRKYVELLKEQQKALEELGEAYKQVRDMTQNYVTMFTGVGDGWKNGIFGGMIKVLERGGDLKSIFKEMSDSVIAMKGDVAGSSLQTIMETSVAMATAFEDARSSFIKSTGASDEAIITALRLSRQYRNLGISMGEWGQAYTSLQTKMASFGQATMTQQVGLTKTVATLGKLGVGVEEISNVVANLNAMFGMSTTQLDEFTREIYAMVGPGLTASDAFTGFSNSIGYLARNGENAVQVFKKLAAQQRVLNVSTQELLNVSKGYDTFEDAATKVGKLNALLGGDYFNTTRMLNLEGADRIEEFVKQFDVAGIKFSELNKYMQQSIAQEAGFSSVGEAAKVLNKSLSEYRVEMAKIEGAQMSPEDLERRAEATKTFSENMISLKESMAVFIGPVIKAANELLNFINRIDTFIQKLLPEFARGWVGVGTILSSVLVIMKMKTAAQMGVNLATKLGIGLSNANAASKLKESVALTTNTGAVTANATATSAAASKMIGLGVAFLGIGVGIGAATAGIAKLTESFKGLTGEESQRLTQFLLGFGLGLGLLVAGLTLLAVKGSVGIAALGIIGVSVLALGTGLFMASQGMASLMNSLRDVPIDKLEAFNTVILSASSAIGILALIGPAIGGAAITISILAGAILLLGASLNTLNQDTLSATTGSLGALSGLLEAIQNTDSTKAIKLKPVFESVKDVIEATNKSKPESTQILERLTNIVVGDKSTGTGRSEGATMQAPLIIKLNDRELSSAIISVVDGMINIKSK